MLAEIDLLKEELRVKDARIAATDPGRRARYKPVNRMAILELRARRGWTQADTARRFHLTDKTIASWMRRLDEEDGQGRLPGSRRQRRPDRHADAPRLLHDAPAERAAAGLAVLLVDRSGDGPLLKTRGRRPRPSS